MENVIGLSIWFAFLSLSAWCHTTRNLEWKQIKKTAHGNKAVLLRRERARRRAEQSRKVRRAFKFLDSDVIIYRLLRI